ncbi:MAG: glutamate-5-semialdehyde dehydrogenase [Desulfocapsaceae bacterium]|jgi:glutamate-5-semialdehyde dehydrogenase|nr:glutamate-5-semialdehyde dehydrogenase [Desulfocapsaceae bacterium]
MSGISTDDYTIIEMSRKAKAASRFLAAATTETRHAVLHSISELLLSGKNAIQRANNHDLKAAEDKGLSSAMLDRLALTDNVIDGMVLGIEQVTALPDPIGQISSLSRRPNGLSVGRMRIPLGVIAMIYESRPNVTIDAAALCLKTGNSVILRGGSEAINSNIALASVLQQALEVCGQTPDAVQVVPTTSREAISILLQQEEFIDLVIPRGGEGLIRFVAEHSRIPVLKHYKGVCHVYVDKDADLDKATPIIINSKVQRPGVCNALEGLLIHADVAEDFLPKIEQELVQLGVTLLGCSRSVEFGTHVIPARDSDWGQEFLELKLCVQIVNSLDDAQDYIDRYGSNHTEVIVSENYTTVNRFIAEVDASAVIVNASTRFNDGGQLGLGTEIGISTTKLHAYGPMGLEELTTRKFVVYGNGQVRD